MLVAGHIIKQMENPLLRMILGRKFGYISLQIEPMTNIMVIFREPRGASEGITPPREK